MLELCLSQTGDWCWLFDVKFLINADCRLQRLVREGWEGGFWDQGAKSGEMLAWAGYYPPPTLSTSDYIWILKAKYLSPCCRFCCKYLYRLKGRWVIRCCFPWGAQHIFYVIINPAIEDTSWARNWVQMMMGNAGTLRCDILKCVHTPDLEIMLMNESFKCYAVTPDTRSQLGVCLMQIILGKCFPIRVLTSE